MKSWLITAALGAFVLGSIGCFIPINSSDPTRRMNQLLNQSEDLRQMEYEWERLWMVDQPSHLTPERIHGGIGI